MYKGMYGDWSVEDEDVREVVAYRAGLNVAALGTVTDLYAALSLSQHVEQLPASTAALLAETAICLTSTTAVPDPVQNAIVISGAAGVGLSLFLVHMYVTPIKQFIQVTLLYELSHCARLHITDHYVVCFSGSVQRRPCWRFRPYIHTGKVSICNAHTCKLM